MKLACVVDVKCVGIVIKFEHEYEHIVCNNKTRRLS